MLLKCCPQIQDRSYLTQVLPLHLIPPADIDTGVWPALTGFQLKKWVHDKAKAPLWRHNPFPSSKTSVFTTENPTVSAPLQKIRP